MIASIHPQKKAEAPDSDNFHKVPDQVKATNLWLGKALVKRFKRGEIEVAFICHLFHSSTVDPNCGHLPTVPKRLINKDALSTQLEHAQIFPAGHPKR